MPENQSSHQIPYSEWIKKVQDALLSPQAEPKDSLDPFQQAELEDKKADTRLKSLYARWFIGILIGQLFVMNLIFISVGTNLLEYKDPSYLKIYMSGTLAEVFGVVLVITRYLFSKKK